MSRVRATAERSMVAERYANRIELHLGRLAGGHDPLGHLFAVERLARAARAERREPGRGTEHERNKP